MTVSATSTSQTVRNLARAQPALAQPADIARLTVIDIENNIVSFSGTFKEGVRDVFSLGGSIFVLSSDGRVRFALCPPPLPSWTLV